MSDSTAVQHQAQQGYPLSQRQRELWQIHCGIGGVHPLTTAVTHIRGPLNEEALVIAAKTLIGRQEALHTGFQQVPGMNEPLQVIGDPSHFELKLVDLTHLEAEKQETCLEAYLDQPRTEVKKEGSPGFAMALFKFGRDYYSLCLSGSALLMDEHSLELVLKDLWNLYGNVHDPSPVFHYTEVAATLDERSREINPEDNDHRPPSEEQAELIRTPHPLELSTTGSSPFQYRHHQLELPWEPTKLEAIGSESETVLLTCWLILLWRWTGSPAVFTSVLNQGRTFDELKSLVGPLSSHIPFPMTLKEDMPFPHLVRQTAKVLSDRRAQSPLFSEVDFRERLGVESEELHFPYGFQWAKPIVFEKHGDLSLRVKALQASTHRFKLKLNCKEVKGTIVTELHYDGARFSSDAITSLHRQFHSIAASVFSNRQLRINQLPLLTEQQVTRLCGNCHEGSSLSFGQVPCHQIIEELSRKRPDAVAVQGEGYQLTLGVLRERVQFVANHLRRNGVSPGETVGVCLERSPELMVAILAILETGSAYVPLDPSYPCQRLDFMVENAQVCLLLTDRNQPKLNWNRGRTLYLEDLQGMASQDRPGTYPVSICLDQTAYILYTSGSTGLPKGVVVTHKGLQNHMLWLLEAFGISETDRILHKTPFSFDASVWEYFAPLMAGGTLVLAKPQGEKDGDYVRSLVNRAAVTVAQFVPTTLQLFWAPVGLGFPFLYATYFAVASL